jgi:hypothetical protein
VAGIGASAGGLDAFKKFFAAMPPDATARRCRRGASNGAWGRTTSKASPIAFGSRASIGRMLKLLVKDLFVGITSFFRNRETFEHLASLVIVPMLRSEEMQPGTLIPAERTSATGSDIVGDIPWWNRWRVEHWTPR